MSTGTGSAKRFGTAVAAALASAVLSAAVIATPVAAEPTTVSATTAADSAVKAVDQTARETAKYNLKKSGLALKGYDPVAYFPEGGSKAVKGSKSRTYTHDGVTYRFRSQANLEKFKADPSKYEPAYGGWCAYAMSKEQYTDIDPKNFKIEGGRLMVFYKGLLGDTLKSWNKEGPSKLEPLADAYWEAETGEEPPAN